MSVAASPVFNPHKSVLRRTHYKASECRTVTYRQKRQSLAPMTSKNLVPPTPYKTTYASRKRTKKIKKLQKLQLLQSITPSPRKKRRLSSGVTSSGTLNRSDERWLRRRISMQTKYTNLGLIGVGSFSHVFKVENETTQKVYALKRSSSALNTRDAVTEALKEVEIMNSLQDKDTKHVITYHDFWISYDRKLHQIYDYYECGTLLDIIEYNLRLNYLQILQIMKQICNGLHCVHSSNIIHIDLKPENIYITPQYILKIGDFGISVNLQNISKQKNYQYKYSGDPIYIAPELMNFDRRLTHKINSKTDIFSLGIILLELICDIKAPSQGKIFHNLRKDIIDFDVMQITESTSNINQDISNEINKDLRILCKNMLNSQSHLRPSCTEIICTINDILRNKRYIKYFMQCEPFSALSLPPRTIVNDDDDHKNNNNNKLHKYFYQSSPKCYDSLVLRLKEASPIFNFGSSKTTTSVSPFRLNLNSAFESVKNDQKTF